MNQLALGFAMKQAGQDAALNAAGVWRIDVIEALRRYLKGVAPGQCFAIEDFRAWALMHGEPAAEPSHHNAWGSLPRIAIGEGLIRWTGDYRPAISARTHAHPVRLYVKGCEA